jgi:hypothetical protein
LVAHRHRTQQPSNRALRFEVAPELLQTEPHPALDGPKRQPQRAGDLCAGALSEVCEGDHLPLGFGKQRQERPYSPGLLALDRLLGEITARGLEIEPLVAAEAAWASAAVTGHVNCAVVDRAQQPCRDRSPQIDRNASCKASSAQSRSRQAE